MKDDIALPVWTGEGSLDSPPLVIEPARPKEDRKTSLPQSALGDELRWVRVQELLSSGNVDAAEALAKEMGNGSYGRESVARATEAVCGALLRSFFTDQALTFLKEQKGKVDKRRMDACIADLVVRKAEQRVAREDLLELGMEWIESDADGLKIMVQKLAFRFPRTALLFSREIKDNFKARNETLFDITSVLSIDDTPMADQDPDFFNQEAAERWCGEWGLPLLEMVRAGSLLADKMPLVPENSDQQRVFKTFLDRLLPRLIEQRNFNLASKLVKAYGGELEGGETVTGIIRSLCEKSELDDALILFEGLSGQNDRRYLFRGLLDRLLKEGTYGAIIKLLERTSEPLNEYDGRTILRSIQNGDITEESLRLLDVVTKRISSPETSRVCMEAKILLYALSPSGEGNEPNPVRFLPYLESSDFYASLPEMIRTSLLKRLLAVCTDVA